MKLTYKNLNLLLLLLFFAALSCTNSSHSTQSASSNVSSQGYDTLQRVSIDSIVNQINIHTLSQMHPPSLAFPFFHPTDSIKYWMVDGKPERISLNMKEGESQIWPTFFVLDGNLVFVRFRDYHATDSPPWVEEKMVYINNGKIVYCNERRKNLQTGDSPGSLSRNSYSVSTHTPEEIENDYGKYWTKIKETMNKQLGTSLK